MKKILIKESLRIFLRAKNAFTDLSATLPDLMINNDVYWI